LRYGLAGLERDGHVDFGQRNKQANFRHAQDRVVVGQQVGDSIVMLVRKHRCGGLDFQVAAIGLAWFAVQVVGQRID
jgi:hypothetical protein